VNLAVLNVSLRPAGGTEIYVRASLEALGASGHRVFAVSADETAPEGLAAEWLPAPSAFGTSFRPGPVLARRAAAGSLRAELERRGVRVALVHSMDALGVVAALQRTFRTVRFVHTAWPYCPAGTCWLPRSNLACARRPGPGCLAVHRREACMTTQEGVPFPARAIARRLLDMRLQARSLRGAAAVVANSRYMADRLRQFIGDHPGLRTLAPPARPSTASPSAPEPMRLLAAGRLVRIKGFSDAIRVAAAIEGATLAVLGDGPERPGLERLAERLGVRPRVEFLGWRSGPALDVEMQRASVVLFPSHWPETFGQVGPEAAMNGRPVVGYDVGGVSDWLSDAVGRLVPAGDLGGLISAARELLLEPALAARLGDEARSRVFRFGREAFAHGLDELVRGVAEGA